MALYIHLNFDDMGRDQMRSTIKRAAKYQSRRQLPYHKRKEMASEQREDDLTDLDEAAEDDIEERANLVEEKRGSCPSCKVTPADLPGAAGKGDSRRGMKVAKVRSSKTRKGK